MNRGIGALLALLLMLGIGLAPVAAQDATPDGESFLAGLGYPELVVTTDGADLIVPAEVEAGRYRLVFQNDGAPSSELNLIQVPEGMTADDVQAAFEEADESDMPPPIIYEVGFAGGVSAESGATGDVVLDLAPGEWIFNVHGFDEDTGDEVDLYQTVTVTGELPALEDPAGVIEIGMVEMAFVIPDGITAGPQIWKVVNNGAQPHHLVLAQVPDGTTEEQVLELLNAFFAPPATPDAGATPVEPAFGFEDYVEVAFTGILSTDQANWLEFDLTPGTYVAISHQPSAISFQLPAFSRRCIVPSTGRVTTC